MCEEHICNVLSPADGLRTLRSPVGRCAHDANCSCAAKHILCSVAIQAKLGDHLVIAMCSAAKPYFSHMSNDALGCGWGRDPLAIWAQPVQTADTHDHYTLASY